jgi:hypothetical protein
MEPIEILKFKREGLTLEKKVFTEDHKQAMIAHFTKKGFVLIVEEIVEELAEEVSSDAEGE